MSTPPRAVHLVFDPKNIFDQPRAYHQIVSSQEFVEDRQPGAKRRAEAAVLAYIRTYLSEPRRFLVLRRWAYAGQQTAEFILRPDPDILAQAGQAASLALVCRLNGEAARLDVIRAASVTGPPNPDLEHLFEGTLDEPSSFGRGSCDQDALDFLSHLPEAGGDIDQPLREWSKYLVWRQKLAEEKANKVYAYDEWTRVDRQPAVKFFLRDPDAREKLKVRFANETLRATASADAKAKAVFQGEFRRIESPGVPDPIRGRGHYHSRKKGDPEPAIEKLAVTLTLSTDGGTDAQAALSTVPESGFLRLAMEGELAAVDIQQNGLQRLAEFRGLNPNLRDWLFDIRKALPCEGRAVEWVPEQSLNEKQRQCVEKALTFDDLLLLWGPPGTGKTTVIAEIASQFCRRGHRVLISSQANLAVDQALETLPRRAHLRPARISTSKKKESLDIDLRLWITRWFGSVAAECKEAATRETDISWNSLLKAWAGHLESIEPGSLAPGFEKHYLKRANVVGATCLETGKPEFRSGVRFDGSFDLAIVDEVSKATPPELLLPALMGRRTLLVGDHRQLPPVFKDSTFPEAIENGVLQQEDFDLFRSMVTTSLFEAYFREADPSICCGLEEQYRMHPHIMAAVNLFYADRPLRAGGGEAKRAAERAHRIQLRGVQGKPWLAPGKHLVWIDTAKDELGFPVNDERVGTSRRNLTEVKVCAKLLLDFSAAQLTVGVISFYRAQIQAIENHLWETENELLRGFVDRGGVNTVDQFQGSERDVIIVSLARTDYPLTGEFVSDFRRINVALSRAKRLLIVLGSGRTFDSGSVRVPSPVARQDESMPAYRKVREMAARNGALVQTADILAAAPPSSWQLSRPSK